MRRVLSGALLFCCAASAAQASVLRESSGLIQGTINTTTDQGPVYLSLPTFNPSLGTLEGVSITLKGSAYDTITDHAGTYHLPERVPAELIALLTGTERLTGTSSFSTISNGLQAAPQKRFDFRFAASSARDFLASNVFAAGLAFLVRDLAGQDTTEVGHYRFRLVETFQYRIVEPGSAALLGAGLAGLALTRRRRLPA